VGVDSTFGVLKSWSNYYSSSSSSSAVRTLAGVRFEGASLFNWIRIDDIMKADMLARRTSRICRNRVIESWKRPLGGTGLQSHSGALHVTTGKIREVQWVVARIFPPRLHPIDDQALVAWLTLAQEQSVRAP
jgi:hypothetical protein